MAHGVAIGAEGDEVVGAVAPTLAAGDVVVDLEEPRGIAEGAAVTVASVDAAPSGGRDVCIHGLYSFRCSAFPAGTSLPRPRQGWPLAAIYEALDGGAIMRGAGGKAVRT